MDEQQPPATPTGETPYAQQPYTPVQPYAAGQPSYGQPPYNAGQAHQPPPGYTPPYAAQPASGLSTNTAAALCYVTIIPAIIFLVVEPYNRNPFIKFNAFQCLGLAACMMVLSIIAIIPILGWIVFLLGWITLVILLLICIVNAAQGKVFKLPVIGDFAAGQAGLQL